jgi:hypothetical protein
MTAVSNPNKSPASAAVAMQASRPGFSNEGSPPDGDGADPRSVIAAMEVLPLYPPFLPL